MLTHCGTVCNMAAALRPVRTPNCTAFFMRVLMPEEQRMHFTNHSTPFSFFLSLPLSPFRSPSLSLSISLSISLSHALSHTHTLSPFLSPSLSLPPSLSPSLSHPLSLTSFLSKARPHTPTPLALVLVFLVPSWLFHFIFFSCMRSAQRNPPRSLQLVTFQVR